MATYHVGRAFLEKLIREHDLHEPTPDEFPDENLIRKLYCEDLWSDEEIAHSMKIAAYNIIAFRKARKIKRSKRYEISQRLPFDDFKHLYLIENMTLVQIAETYDVSDKTISFLKALYAKQEPRLLAHIGPATIDTIITGRPLSEIFKLPPKGALTVTAR